MSDSETGRSVRRGVALLYLPLSANGLPGFVESTLPGSSAAFGALAFAVAVVYLAASVGREVVAAADTPL